MRILVVSDSHSSWMVLYRILEIENPDMLIHCGDWGDRESDKKDFDEFIENVKIPILSIYGNHDNLENICKQRKNYHWLPSFTPVRIQGFSIMGINGNIAHNPRHPWHFTEELTRQELRNCNAKNLDFIITHECPQGYGDILKSRERDETGRHKWKKNVGFESMFEVLKKLEPKFWFCAHIHFQQVAQYHNTIIYNCGYGVKGEYIIIDTGREMKPYEYVWCMRRLGEETNGEDGN